MQNDVSLQILRHMYLVMIEIQNLLKMMRTVAREMSNAHGIERIFTVAFQAFLKAEIYAISDVCKVLKLQLTPQSLGILCNFNMLFSIAIA